MARTNSQLTNEEILIVWQLEWIGNNTDIIKNWSGVIEWLLHNRSASAAPTVNDDSWSWYAVWSRWIDTTADKEYVCLDATATSAVWTETTQSGWGWWSSSAPQFAVNVDGVQIVWELYTYVVNSAVTAWTFRASLKTKPTGADFIIKLYKNGTEDASITIATTDTATNGLYQWTDTTFVSGSYAAWDVLTVEVTQVWSTVAWADLTFSLFE